MGPQSTYFHYHLTLC